MGKNDAGDRDIDPRNDQSKLDDRTAAQLAFENQRSSTTDKTQQAKSTDKTFIADEAERKFLSQGSVQNTLNNQLTTLAGVAKQDPQTASSYPQWATWLAQQNARQGYTEAAKIMEDQAAKAKAVISGSDNVA